MKKWLVISSMVVLASAFSCRAYSQSSPGVFADANHPAGAPDPDKLDDIWQVDPLSGSVSIKIPITTTPVGGRGPKLPFALSYSSSSTVTLQATAGYTLPGLGWWIGVSSPPQNVGTLAWSPKPVTTTSPTGPTGPWTTVGPFAYTSTSQIPDENNVVLCPGNGTCQPAQNFGYGCTITGPYVFVDENGVSHDLSLEAFQYGSSNTTYNNELPPCQQAYTASQTFGNTSYTVDGSAMKTTPTSVFYPDGTTASTGILTDPNGNVARVTWNGGVATATDALGRTVYTTNIPIGRPGQIPAGTYYVKTYNTGGTWETYNVVFSAQTIGSYSLPHPNASNEISTNFYCIASLNCPTSYSVTQPHAGDTFPAISEIDLPNGTSYRFSYDPIYGTVSQILLPTGGSVQFQYSVLAVAANNYGQFSSVSDVAVTDVYTSSGSGDLEHWGYNVSVSGSTPSSIVTAPDGTYTSYTGTCFFYTQVPLYQQGARPSCKEAIRNQYTSAGALLKSVYSSYVNYPGNNNAGSQSNGLPSWVATTLYDGPKPIQQLMKFGYDTYANVTEKDESDFYPCQGSPCPVSSVPSTPPGGWKRITYSQYAYTTNTALASAHIVNKPSQVTITDGIGNPASSVQYVYDNLGNLTYENKCITITGSGASVSCGSYWQTYYQYDTYHQLQSKTEGNNSSKSATTRYTWGGQANGYLKTVTHPNGATDSYTYFENTTGQVQTHTDWNNQTTTYAYGDNLNRITSVTAPQTTDGTTGSTGNGTTTYVYSDTPGAYYVQEKHIVDTSGTTTSTSKYYDGLGRIVRTVTSSPQCASGIAVDTTYDAMSRVNSTSTLYCTSSDVTYGTTTLSYDALGRKTDTILPDGSLSHIDYAGNATETTDPSNGTTNVQHVQQVNGIGQLTNVCEVTSGSLGSGTPVSCGLNFGMMGYMTAYSYDPIGNLLSVSQSGQSRSFVYDNLSRLTQSNNPETGSFNYTYSAPASPCSPDESVPCTRTDARGIVTTYSYDSMSRMNGKSYSNGDLSSCYQYDVPLSGVTDLNAKGQLTLEWEQAGTCPSSSVTSVPAGAVAVRIRSQHDAMGRVGQDQQCLNNASCSAVGQFVYSYNLLGNLAQVNNGISPGKTINPGQYGTTNTTTLNAPSLTWQTNYDSMDHILQVALQDQPSSSVFPAGTYSSWPKFLQPSNYDPFGHMTAANIGVPYGASSGAIQISRQYDDRGRLASEVDGGQTDTSSATPSFGVISIDGSERARYSTNATKASATLSVTGQDGSHQVCQQQCNQFTCWTTCSVVPDTGTVSVTVNGFTSSASFGSGTSDSNIASQLASGFNASGSPVSATASGNTFTLTSLITGTSANYPITLSNSDYTIADKTPSLMGGHQGGCIAYDKGSLTATIKGVTGNSFTYSASANWGQNDTAGTMATKLASAINSSAGSVVTAKAYTSGVSYITLTSTGTGPNTDYALSVGLNDTAATQYTYFLTDPSFSAGTQDMTGGTSAQASSYGTIYAYQAGYAPNGNIVTHTDSVMGTWNFSYDAVDRLVSAQNTGTTSVSMQYANMYGCWIYDAFGNRISEAISTTPCGNNPPLQTWANYNSANNQITGTSISLGTQFGFRTDTAGNTVTDGWNEYWYDAEGRICATQSQRGGFNGPIIQYVYDAEGTRVAKGTLTVAPGMYSTCAVPVASGSTLTSLAGLALTKRFLIGTGGEQVTELAEGGSESWQHTNIWAGSRLSATYDRSGLHFDLADQLGTKREQVNILGVVETRWTSLPFGNDINNPALYSTPDATEHHFTGKERDSESGDDYFPARYYASSIGRFLSPDPLMASAKNWDPQTWNRYTYVRNNPLIMIDPTGMVERTAAQCAFDPNCVTVNINVIYDKNSNGGKGLTDAQKAAFNSGQLQNAKDTYGNADIHFNVTYSAGELTTDEGKYKVSGTLAGALNVLVTDVFNDRGARSNVGSSGAITYLPTKLLGRNSDFVVELAHNFDGDTTGWVAHTVKGMHNAGDAMMFMLFPNAFSNMRISNELGILEAPQMPPSASQYFDMQQNLYRHFNAGARSFQQAITPTTK